ncbi:hypothetical protein FOZ63_019558, partial [Perkinsus olseni]
KRRLGMQRDPGQLSWKGLPLRPNKRTLQTRKTPSLGYHAVTRNRRTQRRVVEEIE